VHSGALPRLSDGIQPTPVRTILRRHIGVRGQGMILAAAIWGLVGLGAVVSPLDSPPPSVWHLTIPAVVRVALWWIPALVAVVLAPSDHRSHWGLGVLALPPLVYGLSYLWGWLMDVFPGPPPGDPRGWLSASFYLLMVAFVVLLAHIPADVRAPLTGRRR